MNSDHLYTPFFFWVLIFFIVILSIGNFFIYGYFDKYIGFFSPLYEIMVTSFLLRLFEKWIYLKIYMIPVLIFYIFMRILHLILLNLCTSPAMLLWFPDLELLSFEFCLNLTLWYYCTCMFWISFIMNEGWAWIYPAWSLGEFQ